MSEPGIPFDQVNVITGDMERSLAFYRLLGLEIADPWGGYHASANFDEGFDFAIDSTDFVQVWNVGWRGRSDLAGRVVLGFRVADRDEVDARYATLVEAGYGGLQPPFDAFWGARYAVVEDPDGLAVGLMSPVDPEKRGAPPAI
jgi:catechol 2,3-dioxygenase-like lactoylglutathione lyase family enzyme